MADIKFVIDVDDADVVNSIQNHQRLEKRVEQLRKQYAFLDQQKNKNKISAQAYARGIQQVDSQINMLNATLAKGSRAVNEMATGMNFASKGANRFGLLTQQAGYQVGDFLVQIQGGTNPFVAFGQQATQLVGVMGMMNPALIGVSAALGIAIPLATALGAAWMRTKDGAKEGEKSIRSLEEAMKSLKSGSEDLELSLAKMKFGTESAEMARAYYQQEILTKKLAEAELEYADALKRVEQNQYSLSAAGAAGRAGQAVNESREQLRLLEEQLRKFQELAEEERKRKEDAEWVTINQENQLQAALEYFDAFVAGQQAAMEEVERTKKEAEALKDELGEALADAVSLSNLDLEAPITLAAIAASNLSLELKMALATAKGLADFSTTYNMMEGSAGAQMLRKYGGRGVSSDKEPIFGETGESIYKEPKKKRGGGGKSEEEKLADRIKKFEEQLRIEKESLGVSEARKRVLQALGTDFVANNPKIVAGYEAQIEAIKEAMRLEEERKNLIASVESALESGFMSMVDGTKSVKDAFKDMARQIIAELYRVLVVQRLVGAIGGAISGIGGGSSLAPTTSIRPQARPFANGGIVGSPTYFPMSGGKTGLMGEAGPEAIMPLKRGPNGRLGVEVQGGGGGVNVTNNINVSGGSDPAAIRAEVAKIMPQITNATKAAVIDARRRGGQMKSAFR